MVSLNKERGNLFCARYHSNWFEHIIMQVIRTNPHDMYVLNEANEMYITCELCVCVCVCMGISQHGVMILTLYIHHIPILYKAISH